MTSNTGPILGFPRIQPFGSDDFHLLAKCEEVGVHLRQGEVRSATALQEVEEVQEAVQKVEDEWRDEEDEENGGLKVEEIRSLHVWT